MPASFDICVIQVFLCENGPKTAEKLFANSFITPPTYIEMMPQATTMLVGYFEIVMDAKIKFSIKFYGKIFARKMVTLAKSGHFTSKLFP